jgi:hypothetical protein
LGVRKPRAAGNTRNPERSEEALVDLSDKDAVHAVLDRREE